MTSFGSIARLAAVLLVGSAAVWQIANAQAPVPMPTQSSAQAGVTVKVTPASLEGAEWRFKVVLDTHSGELGDDLEKTAVLLANGAELRPVQWQGAGPGGHHREGQLSFRAPAPTPAKFAMRIQRANESSARTFQWDLTAR
jgi:hypothetical protein